VKISKYLLPFLLFLLGINFSIAQENLPPVEKKAIQEIVVKETAKRFEMDADRLRLKDRFTRRSKDWIFISFDIKNPSGGPVDYTGVRLHEAAPEDTLKDTVEALLHKKNTHWELVDIAVYTYDVAWEEWGEKYKAPKHIFNIVCMRPTPGDCQELNQMPAAWRGTWHPRSYGARPTTSEPSMIIEDQSITWEPCGPNARKVHIFSEFFGKSGRGMLLEIEGEPCSYTDYGNITHSISYIYLDKEKKEEPYNNWACPAYISIHETPYKLSAEKYLYGNVYTKTNCSAFDPSERIEMLKSIRKAATTQLKIEHSQGLIFDPRHHLEATGDWVFITVSAAIFPKEKIIVEVPEDALSHFISALLRRKGSTWELVEIDVDVVAKKKIYPEWRKRHHIPQDSSDKRICPEACPS